MDYQSNNGQLATQMLLAVGFSQEEAIMKQKEIDVEMNAVIIDSIFNSLTPDEQEKLKVSLKLKDPSDVSGISQVLRDACNSSFNKVNVDRVSDDARIKVAQSFWNNLLPKLSEEQRSKLNSFLLGTIKNNQQIVDVVNKFV